LVPGRRPHEADRLRFQRRSRRLASVLGVVRGSMWRVPRSWSFFHGFSLTLPAVEGHPRVSVYLAWYWTWVVGSLSRTHRPRRLHRLIQDRWRSLQGRVQGRRYTRRGVLILAARVTPPDRRSQRRVAFPLRAIFELCIFLGLRTSQRELKIGPVLPSPSPSPFPPTFPPSLP
jgi:hypothetical protein